MKKFHTLALALAFAATASATGKPPPSPPPHSGSMLAEQTQRVDVRNVNHVDAHADAHADAHSSSRATGGNAYARGGRATSNAQGGRGGAAHAAGGSTGAITNTNAGGSTGPIDASSGIGSIAPQQNVGGDSVRSLALSLAVQPPAFTPPMPMIANCAAHVRQSASSGWIVFGGYSQAQAEADPTNCTLLDIRNAKVESCQYADAQQIEDRMVARMLPGYESVGPKHANLAVDQCRMLKSPPPPAPVVNYVYSAPEPVALPTLRLADAAKACAAPKRSAARKVVKAACGK